MAAVEGSPEDHELRREGDARDTGAAPPRGQFRFPDCPSCRDSENGEAAAPLAALAAKTREGQDAGRQCPRHFLPARRDQLLEQCVQPEPAPERERQVTFAKRAHPLHARIGARLGFTNDLLIPTRKTSTGS